MKIYIYLFTLLCLFACQTNKDDCKDLEFFLEEFRKGISEKLPPANSNIFLFFKLDGNNIIKLNNIELYDLYEQGYNKNYSFEEFLCKLFDDKLNLKSADFKEKKNQYQILKINSDVEKLNLESLKTKFCVMNKHGLSLNHNLDESTQITVLYVLFKNKYYISFDDYAGEYVIKHKIH